MSLYVSIDWDLHSLRVVTGEVSRGKVDFGTSFQLDLPGELVSAPAAKLGEWLASAFKERGLTAEKGLVALPREGVVFRPLELPLVSDEELPDLVRLQAETRSTISLDRLAVDYLPLPKSGETRTVLLVTAPSERLGTIREALRLAGVELERVGLSMVATGELLFRSPKFQSALEGDVPALVLVRAGKRVELGVFFHGVLAYSHDVQLSGENETADGQFLATELRRALMGADKILQGRKATRCLMIDTSEEGDPRAAFLSGKLSIPFERVPLADLHAGGGVSGDADACFAGALGMLQSRSGAKMPAIDLIHPRKARPIVDIQRRRLKFGGIALAVLVLLFVVFSRWQLASMDDELASIRGQKLVVDEALKLVAPVLKSHDVIDDWARRDVSMLDQTADLKKALPGTDRIYLADLRINAALGDELFRIQALGSAVDRSDVETLYQQLADQRYRVRGSEIPRTSKDSKYPYRMQLDISILSKPAGTAGNGSPATGTNGGGSSSPGTTDKRS